MGHHIALDQGRFTEQFRQILSAAEPLSSPGSAGGMNAGTSGPSRACELLAEAYGELCSCATQYYQALQEDCGKALALLDQMLREDEQIGEVIGHGGRNDHQTRGS